VNYGVSVFRLFTHVEFFRNVKCIGCFARRT